MLETPLGEEIVGEVTITNEGSSMIDSLQVGLDWQDQAGNYLATSDVYGRFLDAGETWVARWPAWLAVENPAEVSAVEAALAATNPFGNLTPNPTGLRLVDHSVRASEQEVVVRGKITNTRKTKAFINAAVKVYDADDTILAMGDTVDEVPAGQTWNFQAAMYLCHYRTERPDEPLEFTFFHFLETLEDVITGDHDIEDTLTTVSYYPWTFDEHVGSREAYDALLDGYNDCVETFEDLGFDAYTEIMGRLSFPETTEKDELRASVFAKEFTTAVEAVTAGDVDAEKGCDQAIRLLNGVRKKTFFREDLDAIEGFVQERIEELNRYRAGDDRFPIEGPGGEPNYRRVDNRDCILEGASDE